MGGEQWGSQTSLTNETRQAWKPGYSLEGQTVLSHTKGFCTQQPDNTETLHRSELVLNPDQHRKNVLDDFTFKKQTNHTMQIRVVKTYRLKAEAFVSQNTLFVTNILCLTHTVGEKKSYDMEIHQKAIS